METIEKNHRVCGAWRADEFYKLPESVRNEMMEIERKAIHHDLNYYPNGQRFFDCTVEEAYRGFEFVGTDIEI